MVDPRLGALFFRAFDAASGHKGSSRNRTKSHAILHAPEHVVQDNAEAWALTELAELANVCRPEERLLQLGAALGGPEARAEHFARKTLVVQAMHEKVRQCVHTRTECVLARACLGPSKTSHLLRACGLDLWQEKCAIQAFNDVAAATLKRMFVGIDEQGVEQAAFCTIVGGLGVRAATGSFSRFSASIK